MHPLIRAAAQRVGFNPLAWLSYTQRMRRFGREYRVPQQASGTTQRFAVVVTPWIGSAVPWFSFACGLLLATNGNKVTFVIDDLPFGDKPLRYRFVLGCIQSVVNRLRNRLEVVDLSAHRSVAPLSAEARKSISRLATLNAVWAMRGEMVETGRQSFVDTCSEQLNAAYGAIAAVMQPGRFDVLFIPGGVYGTSGLWVERARAARTRIASFDNGGYGALMLASEGLACQMHDIPRAFALLKRSCVSAQEREFVFDTAHAEIAQRRSGVDTFASQMRETRSVGARFDGAVLLALNSSWDSAALGLHTVFENNMDWIVQTVRYLLEHTQATVVVRQHPAERLDYARTSDDYSALLRRNFGTQPRLIFIAADEQINSYELLERVAAVVVYTSTIGTEAAASGKPVITPSNSYYSDLGFVWKAVDRRLYENCLAAAAAGTLQVTAAMREDALFCYYLTQCSQWVFSPFNPADFAKWSRLSLRGLHADANVSTVLKSLEQNIPVAFLNHQAAMQKRLAPGA